MHRARLARRQAAAALAALLAALALPPAAAGGPRTVKEKRMSDEDSFSRIGPPDVAPVVFEGRRYEQVVQGDDQQLDQRTGYLAVIDVASGRRLAAVKVYEVAFDPAMEADVQDVFFVRMELQPGQRRLLIENEHGLRRFVDLDSHAVTPAP